MRLLNTRLVLESGYLMDRLRQQEFTVGKSHVFISLLDRLAGEGEGGGVEGCKCGRFIVGNLGQVFFCCEPNI